MKHSIYALADPNTHEVRYVGQTTQPLSRRLAHHMGAARRNVQKPVYDWLRSLGSKSPIIVCLQTVDSVTSKSNERTGYESTAMAAEVKWMKRFERSICNSIVRNRAYRKLVNPSY